MTDAQRQQFDRMLEQVLDELPPRLHELLEEVPLVVEDRASAKLRRDLDLASSLDLFGLHSGVPLTERSVEAPARVPDQMMIFREPIWRAAGRNPRALREQIRITVLHEIGHHFGLDEDDLEELGYG